MLGVLTNNKMNDFIKAVQGDRTVAIDSGVSNAHQAVELLRQGKLQECLDAVQEDHTLQGRILVS